MTALEPRRQRRLGARPVAASRGTVSRRVAGSTWDQAPPHYQAEASRNACRRSRHTTERRPVPPARPARERVGSHAQLLIFLRGVVSVPRPAGTVALWLAGWPLKLLCEVCYDQLALAPAGARAATAQAFPHSSSASARVFLRSVYYLQAIIICLCLIRWPLPLMSLPGAATTTQPSCPLLPPAQLH